MERRLFPKFGLTLSFSLLLAAGCSGPSDNRRELLVWGRSLGADDRGEQEIVAQFEHDHPDIKVRVFNLGSGNMNPQKLMTAIVGKVPPDVIYQDRFSIADWASRGAFQPLDNLVKRDASEKQAPREIEYYPAAWNECKFGGQTFGIPSTIDDRVLYWHRALFRQNADKLRAAGLDPLRAPKTWEETLAYSKVLTQFNADGTLKVAGFAPNFGNSWLYLFGFQADAQFIDATGHKCLLNSPETVKALTFMKQGYDLLGGYANATKFINGLTNSGIGKPILTGHIAMVVDGDWQIGELLRYGPDADIAAAPPPVPAERLAKGKGYVTWSGGHCWAIPAGAKHTEDAWTFIKWMTSPQARLAMARSQRLWDKRRGREFVPRLAAHIETSQQLFNEFKPTRPQYAAIWKEHLSMLPFARFRPTTFVGQLLWDEHARATEVGCLGAEKPEQALQEGQDKVQRALDEAFSRDKYPEVSSIIPIGLFFAVLCGLFGATLYKFKTSSMTGFARRQASWGFFLISPWIFGFCTLTLLPMLYSLFYAFVDTNVMNAPHWVGLRNFHEIIGPERPKLMLAFVNVITLAGIGVPLGILTGLSVALLLNQQRRGIRGYRTAFYLPSLMPGVVGAVLWAWLLMPDQNLGLVNYVWSRTITEWLHLPPPGWLNSPDWAKPAFIIMGLAGAGGGLVMWLAALKAVPKELYEAATLDGANPVKQFQCVTWARLSPVVFFSVTVGFIGAIQEFERAYIFAQAGAGPLDSLLLPVPELFKQAFGYFRMGYASALAWVIFLFVLLVTGLQFLLGRYWVEGSKK